MGELVGKLGICVMMRYAICTWKAATMQEMCILQKESFFRHSEKVARTPTRRPSKGRPEHLVSASADHAFKRLDRALSFAISSQTRTDSFPVQCSYVDVVEQ